MTYHGDIALGQTIDLKFSTRQANGTPTTLAGTPVISAYVGNSVTEITAGITLTVDFDSRTGLHNVRVVATSGNGFATATDVELVITTGTVNAISVVGEVIGSFSIENRSAIRPTVSGRTLDITATGAAGIDWANVENPTTVLNLSATNIDVDQIVASVSGAVGSVTGAVGSVTGSVGSVTGAVGSVTGAVGSVTGNVGGNVVGSVASVTGNVGGNVNGNVVGSVGSVLATVAANLTQILGTALTETSGQIAAGFKKLLDVAVPVFTLTSVNQTGDNFARLGAPIGASISADIAAVKAETVTILADTNDIQTRIPAALVSGRMDSSVGAMAANVLTASALATDAVNEIVDQTWDELIAGHLGVGSTGEALSTASAGGNPAAIADAVWDEDATGHQTQGSFGQVLGDSGADTDTIWALVNTNLDATIASRASASQATAIQADTDDIQTRLPAALVGGRIDSNVGAVTAGAIAAASFAAGALDAVWTVAARTLTAFGFSVTVGTNSDKTGYTTTAADQQASADELLNRNIAGSGSGGARIVRDAIRLLRNRRRINGGVLTVYQEDDTTAAFTATTTSAAGNPLTEVDPA